MSTFESQKGLDLYKQAGVDVEKGDELVEWLKSSDGRQASHSRFGAPVAGIGGFSALFRPNFKDLEDPLLVSGTDGVGTKVLLGIETGILAGLGIDLVAMCVNDLYTLGARPLFFLDYYATGRLNADQFKAVLTGIKQGCAQSGAALLGGETAEMPGLYEHNHFDLAGFVVGVVDGKRMLGPDHVKTGDKLYALAASGFHSNGYSLVRRWVKDNPKSAPDEMLTNLMTPTRIYHEIPEIVDELGTDVFHALANITGGGISGNLPRVMPPGSVARIDLSSLPVVPWMEDFVEANGSTLSAQEAVFNIGAGMIAIIDKSGCAAFEAAAHKAGLPVAPIGELVSGESEASEASVQFI